MSGNVEATVSRGWRGKMWYADGGKGARQHSVGKPAARWLTATLVALFNVAFSSFAWAAEPDHVSFTLEGCRSQDGYDPDTGDLVCDAAAYTTGNLGKLWNELDLVPFRLTAETGNAAPSSQTYIVALTLDAQDAGHPGYDVISVPVLNTDLSSGSCLPPAVGADTELAPGVGGIDVSRYRTVTITQSKNTTCVYDYYGRLAVGSHLFPGSSLHANLLNETFTTSGIGAKDVSIPVKEIAPQELAKDMSATQDSSHIWELTKGPGPAAVHFGNVCEKEGDGPYEEPVTISVTWTKLPAAPSGQIAIVTHVYATNPAARTVTTNVTDVIYSGTTALDTASSGPIDVPANTANVLVLTHMTTVPADSTDLNDVATATYTDTLTGEPVPGETTATATATVQTGTTLNGTATIIDSESITGSGLSFKVGAPLTGNFTNYTAGNETTGPVEWDSGLQGDSGFVDFEKTVILADRQITSGTLSDTATLNGTDGFGPITASASIDIDSSAIVELTVEKTIPPGILNAGDAMEIAFDVTRASDTTFHQPVIFTFEGGGELTLSDVVTGPPDTYTVTETSCQLFPSGSDPVPCGLVPVPTSDSANLNLPNCADTVSFENGLGAGGAQVQVQKITNPVTDEADPWEFTLSCVGVDDEVTQISANSEPQLFATALEADTTCTVTETEKEGWDLNSAQPNDGVNTKVCSFSVDLPADAGTVFGCTFTNTQRGMVEVTKLTNGQDDSTTTWNFSLTGPEVDATDNTADGNPLDFDGAKLIPGETYTLCESGLTAGWSSNWYLDANGDGTIDAGDTSITPYNPDSVDLGNRCYDFQIQPGDTLAFAIDNDAPSGNEPRTPGYWKNWNSCTGGNQAQTAANNGGAAEGFFLLDDLLPQTVGDLTIDTCEAGVRILDKRDLSGTKRARDAAYNLATALLAAQLNLGADAVTCDAVVTATEEAQALLEDIDFDGTGSYLPPKGNNKSLRNQATSLAGTLDSYNNGLLCP